MDKVEKKEIEIQTGKTVRFYKEPILPQSHSDKEIEEMVDAMPSYVMNKDIIARRLINEGYGKVEDYKKEIARLKEEKNRLVFKCEYVSQQVIKEFSKKLSKRLIEFCEENINNDGTVSTSYIYIDFLGVKAMDGKIISRGVLDDLLKEYGIGEE